MAGPGGEDIDIRYLQIQPKQDSPARLLATAGVPAKYLLSAEEFEVLREYVNDLRDRIDAISEPFLIYEATLTTTGDVAPVPTVLRNTLGWVPNWHMFDSGRYTITNWPEGLEMKNVSILVGLTIGDDTGSVPSNMNNSEGGFVLTVHDIASGVWGGGRLQNTAVQIKIKI